MTCDGCNRKALPNNFLSKINFTDTCWLWSAAKNKYGYGVFTIDRKKFMSHRFSWIQFNSEIPRGMMVCHKCDVRNCVNPDHLFLGTHKDNMRDMVAKGRSAKGERQGKFTHPESVLRGEKVGNSKLTANQVYEIRRIYKRGTHLKCEFSTVGLAKKFGVSRQQISNIVKNRGWVDMEVAGHGM